MSVTSRVEARLVKAAHEITLDGRRVTVSCVVKAYRGDPTKVEISGSYQQAGKVRRTGITRIVLADRKITVHNLVTE